MTRMRRWMTQRWICLLLIVWFAGSPPVMALDLRGVPSTIAATSLTLTTPLAATSGGTGFASYTVGDLLYADTTTSLAKRAAVASGQVLASAGTGTAPAYSAAPTLTSMTVAVGGSTSTGKTPALATVSVTQTGTGADTSEDTLWTYDLPANTLNANGKAIRIIALGTTAANNNNKTLKLYFGTSTINPPLVTTNTGHWRFEAYVYRTGSSTQVFQGFFDIGVSDMSTTTRRARLQLPTETDTAAITIKVTGLNGTSNANDIILYAASVEVLN